MGIYTGMKESYCLCFMGECTNSGDIFVRGGILSARVRNSVTDTEATKWLFTGKTKSETLYWLAYTTDCVISENLLRLYCKKF